MPEKIYTLVLAVNLPSILELARCIEHYAKYSAWITPLTVIEGQKTGAVDAFQNVKVTADIRKPGRQWPQSEVLAIQSKGGIV